MPLRDLNEDREPRPKALLLGHIRLGVFKGGHPQQTETLVFTSADPDRLKPLHDSLGGTIERYEPQGAGGEPWRLVSEAEAFTALFPFGAVEGNLSQSWELWARSGIKRRCDGFDCALIDADEMTGEYSEEQVPCICRADEERECSPTTRLRLLLPQTGLGIWELTTGSRIAATQLYDQVQFIASVAGDRMNFVPVRVVYQPREISYFDEKKKQRLKTTKRIVSLSIAGDAERALAPMGMKPDQGLIAAVREVLVAGGHAPELGDGGASGPAALPDGSPAPPAKANGPDHADHGTEAPEAPTGDAGDGAVASPVATSGVAGDQPATSDHWARAKALKLSGSVVLRRVRARYPDADVKSVSAITTDQLAAVLDEAMAS